MGRLSAQAARARWRGPGQLLARQVATCLINDGDVEGLGLESIDGRTDLRGLWVVNPMRYLPHGAPPGSSISAAPEVMPWANGVAWRNLDLSHTTLPIRLRGARVENVVLDGAGLQSWWVLESELTDVSLRGAYLDHAVLDGNPGLQDRPLRWSPTTWNRCDFSRAHLENVPGFGRARLIDCRFEGTQWPRGVSGGFDFRGASLRGCCFEGKHLDLRFGWTGPIRKETPPWVEVYIPEDQVGDCVCGAVSGPGIITSAGRG